MARCTAWLSVLFALSAWAAGLATAARLTAGRRDIQAAALQDESLAAFDAWALQYGRSYRDPQERTSRYEVWRANVQRYRARNERLQKMSSLQLGLNGLSDLTSQEFKARFIAPRPLDAAAVLHAPMLDEPVSWRYEHVKPKETVDWRTEGIIGPVRSQHAHNWSCGGCWAFATVGIAEASSALGVGGPVIAGSEQQLIDCDTRDHGCDGGAFKHGLDYVIEHGLTKEDKYPYAGEDQKCNKSLANDTAIQLDDWETVPRHNETALLQAVTMRPVVTAVCCGDDIDAWHAYKGGVFDVPCCVEKVELDHAMVIVGYGTDKQGGDYWLMKNSWSDSWGENGFMKMKRNDPRAIGHCAVASMPTMAFRGKKPKPPPGQEQGNQDGESSRVGISSVLQAWRAARHWMLNIVGRGRHIGSGVRANQS